MYYCESHPPPPPPSSPSTKLKAQIAVPLFLHINAKYISRTHEVDLYNANAIRFVVSHTFPSLCDALSCGFIPSLQLGHALVWGEVFEALMKCKPLPVVKRRPFLIKLKITLVLMRMLCLCWRVDSAPWGLQTVTVVCYFNVLTLDVQAYFAAATDVPSARDVYTQFSGLLPFILKGSVFSRSQGRRTPDRF